MKKQNILAVKAALHWEQPRPKKRSVAFPAKRHMTNVRYFIGWRNQMMSGDTYHRGPDAPRDDMAKYLRQEIARLQALLPEGAN